jgi:hypothetical protein
MIQDSCIAALSAALNQKICKGRGTPRCVSASIGILVKSFHEMDMPIYHSHPAGAPSPLHNSVRSYWEAINQMAIKNNFCLKGQSRVDCCSWEQCMSHLDPKVAVNAALEKYKHNGLDGDWASVEVCRSYKDHTGRLTKNRISMLSTPKQTQRPADRAAPLMLGFR